MNQRLELDGSFGEGGGSILRVSAGLACVKNCSIYINNIRKNRKNPGLRQQHLVGIEALSEITQGTLNRLEVGTTEVNFTPGQAWKKELNLKIETAGNIGLLSQTLHNGFYKAPSTDYHINIDGGGTYGKYAPGTSYVQNVTYQIFRQLGYIVDLNIIKHGFYPKGGAQAHLRIHPNYPHYKGLWLEERAELEKIHVQIIVESRLQKPQVAERIKSAILENLKTKTKQAVELDIVTEYQSSLSTGVGVDAWISFSDGEILGTGTILGERGVSSEKIGTIVAKRIIELLSGTATVDEYAADQILPFLFCIEKPSKFKVESLTSHFKTNLELIQQFFPRETKITKQTRGFLIEIFE